MRKVFSVVLFLLTSFSISAQSGQSVQGTKQAPTYSYTSVTGDPLKARIYKLSNGLTVYMTVYKDAPRIQTYIAVKAGSKNDPSDATGLAHYLEHMLFKGNESFGTKNFEKEKAEIGKIIDLYEVYRVTKDEAKRKLLYHQIDSISGVASEYAIANEYDKMLSSIGAEGTNAYTSFEQTVYVNDIPANQLKNWLKIEANRFNKPVMRLFHTELEAVYEEKNRGLDNDNVKVYEALLEGLFQKHTYGTQTTIGTIEHLKNPSIKKIQQYYDTYYVPNNMAICLSGDFDMDKTIALIDQTWGKFKSKLVPEFVPPVEEPIKSPVVKEVYGPETESMVLAYRFAGAGSREADIITLIDKILYNNTAGLIDLDLNQSQKVLNASSGVIMLKDYSVHALDGTPREGQKLEEVTKLLLEQIEKVKKGDFPDWLLTAIINDLKLQQLKGFEKNSVRADAFVNAFVLGQKWDDYILYIDRLARITKEEIVAFAREHYKDNYVLVYKRTGEDKNVQKVEKPPITPVKVNRDEESPFVKEILSEKVPDIKPVFVDYQKDILHLKTKKNIELLYKKNEENKLFDLFYIVEMGSNTDKKIGLAVSYLPYLGTSKYSPAALQQEFYKIGCSFSVFNSEDQVYVNLNGLSENFGKAVRLFEELLADPQPDTAAYQNLVADILKKRADAKLNKSAILWQAMYNYGKFGPKSAFTNILSEEELKTLNSSELADIIKKITRYEHHILYYGPFASDQLITDLNTLHKTPANLLPVPPALKFTELENNENKVSVINYNMKQAEILMLSKSQPFNKSIVPAQTLFNEYYGGSMSSVVFQEMRESKALAYSVFSSYQTPKKLDKSHYVIAYIGTQADKLPEAMAGMSDLLNNLPESPGLLKAAKDAIIQKIETERITKTNILFSYEKAKKLGLDYDIRKDIYSQVPKMSMAEVKSFHDKYIKDKKFNILVLGDKAALDEATLKKYGQINTLSLQQIFGY